MRKQSLSHNICICCNTNRSPDAKQLLCKNCHIFIHDKLQLTPQLISQRLGMNIYTKIIHKCSFCKEKAVISYKDYENNKKYYICDEHKDRWLKIGCQLGELSNFLKI